MLEFVPAAEADENGPIGYEPRIYFDESKDELVESWSVGWMTPKGLLLKLEQALAWCKSVDLDPNAVLRPVVVAHGKTDFEVFP